MKTRLVYGWIYQKNEQTLLTLLRMISGARYSGVPQRVHVLPLTLLAKPKSVTFRYPFSSINKFSGFKSLCTKHYRVSKRRFHLLWKTCTMPWMTKQVVHFTTMDVTGTLSQGISTISISLFFSNILANASGRVCFLWFSIFSRLWHFIYGLVA